MTCNTCGDRRTITYAESTCQAAHEGPCPSCVGVTIATVSLPSASVGGERERIAKRAFRIAYAPLRSAQHALDLVSRMGKGEGCANACRKLADEESRRIDNAIAGMAYEDGERKTLAAPETPPTGNAPTPPTLSEDLLDTCPEIKDPASGPEPSLREMVRSFYNRHAVINPDAVTDQYFAALSRAQEQAS